MRAASATAAFSLVAAFAAAVFSLKAASAAVVLSLVDTLFIVSAFSVYTLVAAITLAAASAFAVSGLSTLLRSGVDAPLDRRLLGCTFKSLR